MTDSEKREAALQAAYRRGEAWAVWEMMDRRQAAQAWKRSQSRRKP